MRTFGTRKVLFKCVFFGNVAYRGTISERIWPFWGVLIVYSSPGECQHFQEKATTKAVKSQRFQEKRQPFQGGKSTKAVGK